jgi:hypothetical protein
MFVLYIFIFFILKVNSYYWHETKINLNENYSKTNSSIAIQYLTSNYALGCPENEVLNWSCKWCNQYGNQYLTPYNFIMKDNVKAGILIDQEYKIIIVNFNYFISNTLIEDLVYTECNSTLFNDNIDFYYKRVCVGDYYEKLYNKIREDLYLNIHKISKERTEYRFIFTGYSIGAALATISSLDLKLRLNLQIKYVYTFGSPRVGNIEFTKLYYENIKNTYRMTHNYDPVPTIPSVEKGFNHVSSEVWQLGNRIVLCSDTQGLREYDKCINTIEDYRFNLENHYNYMKLNYQC